MAINLNTLANQALQPAASTGASSSASKAMSSMMGKDDFLKLFLASMQYQDPMNAMDTNQMMSQMSQLTLIEQVQNMSKAVESFSAVAQTSALDSGMKFLGKQIKGVDQDGNTIEGRVDQVRSVSGAVELVVGDKTVPLQQVASVEAGQA
ncbi:flagellar hook capping FlgD N-terminal domain-containing protein [Ectobacillus ponti]|uniref:Flagellar hook assembly protein FlgD n=1 Tax=Ectobacillus ponti TaxID=2961894 RepID=A0AA41X9I4_9BACI|nr:flagellar hook capping FlgD N-terminal domain-containing protein [Ectobacillus ponti]MCP8968850.1 flagellar hook assembly protein FlgD [Ectobacillus ponti]